MTRLTQTAPLSGLPAQVWGAIWTTVSCLGLTAAILGGIVNFKDDFAAQYFNAQTFLPT